MLDKYGARFSTLQRMDNELREKQKKELEKEREEREKETRLWESALEFFTLIAFPKDPEVFVKKVNRETGFALLGIAHQVHREGKVFIPAYTSVQVYAHNYAKASTIFPSTVHPPVIQFFLWEEYEWGKVWLPWDGMFGPNTEEQPHNK